jgi:hypothetical protein
MEVAAVSQKGPRKEKSFAFQGNAEKQNYVAILEQ